MKPVYRVTLGGEMELAGQITGTIPSGSSALQVASFPSSLAPPDEVRVVAAVSQTTSATVERADITTGGLVLLYTSAVAHTWVSLDGIRFRIV